MFSIAPFIIRRSIPEIDIRYEWDDWNTEAVEDPPNPEAMETLVGVSFRGVVAYTIGTAEWIISRYLGLVDTALPVKFTEASWVAQIDRRFLQMEWEDHPEAESWIGPAKGPLGVAMTRVMYAAQQAETMEDPELRAGWITNLARHVLVNPDPYLRWQRWFLQKLREDYPRSAGDPLGPVIPRVSLDPDAAPTAEPLEYTVNAFLATVNPQGNPFLKSGVALKQSGFQGEPYLFDVESDERYRLDSL